MSDTKFLKGLNPEFKCPATAVFADGEDVSFTTVWRRTNVKAREAINMSLMAIMRASVELRQKLSNGELDDASYAAEIGVNNQKMVDLIGAHLLRCEGLKYNDGTEVTWSTEVYQQMIATHEYGGALGNALKLMASGQKVEQDEGNASPKLAIVSSEDAPVNAAPAPETAAAVAPVVAAVPDNPSTPTPAA